VSDLLPIDLTDDQRRAVWLAQYRLANSRLREPEPDSACVALAEERVASAGQRESDIAAWQALRETLLPGVANQAAAIQAAVMADRDLTLQALDACFAEGTAAIANEIRARPIDLGALANAVRAARTAALQEALEAAQSYKPMSITSDGADIPGAMIGANSAKRVIVQAIAALIDDGAIGGLAGGKEARRS
jgi:hypothetical protein